MPPRGCCREARRGVCGLFFRPRWDAWCCCRVYGGEKGEKEGAGEAGGRKNAARRLRFSRGAVNISCPRATGGRWRRRRRAAREGNPIVGRDTVHCCCRRGKYGCCASRCVKGEAVGVLQLDCATRPTGRTHVLRAAPVNMRANEDDPRKVRLVREARVHRRPDEAEPEASRPHSPSAPLAHWPLGSTART